MSYLRVECSICGAYWNYFDKKFEQYLTAVDYQGCVCPNCGSIGFMQGSASDETMEKSNIAMEVNNGNT